MKNKTYLLGILAMVLVFTMTVAGCVFFSDLFNIGGGNMTWTTVTSSTFGTSGIYAIAYGNNKFVAGGADCKMAYSTDGATWKAITQSVFNSSSDTITAIAYGNGTFIAVGYQGKLGQGQGKMAYSTDGATWKAVTNSPFSDTTIHAIAYGNNKFVAGGYKEWEVSTGVWKYQDKTAYSSDGVNWSEGTNSTFGTGLIYAIEYGNNKFVAGNAGGEMAYSTDGVNWKTVTNSTFTGTICSIAYGDNQFVAGGIDGKMAYSADGATWTAVSNSTFGTTEIRAIAYGNSKFVAVGSGGKMAYSTDGVTWTAITNSTFGSSTIYCIAYGNNKFVAGSLDGKIAYSSDDTGNNGGGGGGGTLTITDIPATYNDQYVHFVGMLMSQQQYIIGAKSVSVNGSKVTITSVQIKNGKVSLPMWVLPSSGSVSRYSGNDTFDYYQSIGIYDSETLSLDSGESGPHQVKSINFPSVSFSNGSATKSCNDATNF